MPILTPCESADELHFKAIAQAKRGILGRRLRGLWPRIRTRYNEYISLIPNLEGLTDCPLGPVHRSDAQYGYSGKSKALSRLKAEIIAALPVGKDFYCQYCLISERDALDHYAPKERFPEFSVLPRNLVPCCGACNRRKSDVWLKNGLRVMFNLYYEDYPDTRYLFVEVDFRLGGGARIDFSLRNQSGIDAVKFQRLEYHFDQLELCSRLNGAAATLLSEDLATATSINNRNDISRLLLDQATDHERMFGVNYWKAVLRRNLASSTGFFAVLGL